MIQEHKNDEKSKTALEDAKKLLATSRDNHKKALREVKSQIGVELYNRFFKGFLRDRNNTAEDNERISHTEFLFKTLKF